MGPWSIPVGAWVKCRAITGAEVALTHKRAKNEAAASARQTMLREGVPPRRLPAKPPPARAVVFALARTQAHIPRASRAEAAHLRSHGWATSLALVCCCSRSGLGLQSAAARACAS